MGEHTKTTNIKIMKLNISYANVAEVLRQQDNVSPNIQHGTCNKICDKSPTELPI